MHRISCSVSVLALVIGWSWQFAGPVPALEVGVPLSTPRLTGLQVEFPAGEATVVLVATLRYDAKGKVVGEATVDGAATTVKGGLKKKGDVWVYSVAFKGITEKLSLKITGVVGTGFAGIKYSGPKGKANLPEFPISLQASVGSTSGQLEVSLQVDPKGKITGTGTFTSGLGNDPPGEGIVKGKVTRTSLSVSFKSGKQKLAFKGAIGGEYFVGLLKVTSPPAKEKVESFRFPVSAFPVPPPDDDDGTTDREDYYFGIFLASSNPGADGGSFSVNTVTTSKGKKLRRGYLDLHNNLGGNVFVGNLDGIEFGIDEKLPPEVVGRWFQLPMFRYLYDLQNNRFTKQERIGTFTILVGKVEENLISGTWRFEGTGGELHQEGTWNHVPVPPPPADPVEYAEPVHFIDLILGGTGASSVGITTVYRNTRRSGAMYWGALISATRGETSYGTDPSLPEMPAIPPLPSVPGSWLTLPVVSIDPVSGAASPYGSFSMVVGEVQGSVVSGTWRLEVDGATAQAGTWSLDTDPILSTEATHYLNLDLSGQDPATGGYFTVYKNTRRSGAVEWTGYAVGLTADAVSFWTGDGEAVPIPALPAAPGSWFTIPVTSYDNAASVYVPFGSLTLGVGAASEGSLSGTWSVKDLGGAERGAGTWGVSL